MKYFIVLVVIIAIVGVKFMKKSSKNVCRTFKDYYSDLDKNENCYYNPDESLSVPEIIQRNGYPQETHHVTTKDGYILTMFRIPQGKHSGPDHTKKPVFIQHGFGSNSAAFVNRQEKSLGFIVADEGYDVWLGNFRGSAYSKNHTNLTNTNYKFWDFSVHEHGVFDIPAQLSYVQNITGKKILYIGYSLGTMAMYIYGVTFPEMASEQVDFFINLAPSTYLNNTKTIIKYVIPYWFIVQPMMQFITSGQLFARVYPPDILKVTCYPFPIQLQFCQIPEMLLAGFSYEQNDPETLPISFMQNGDWISIKGLTHLTQYVTSGKFQNYDYGFNENKRIYGSIDPPYYNLTKMNVPTYFIRAENDLVTTKENVELLYNSLPKEAKPSEIYVIKDKSFNHYDFMTGKDVVPLLYNHIVDVLRNR